MLLVDNYNEYFPQCGENYLIKDLYHSNQKIFRILRKIHLKSQLPLKGIWFKKWEKYINKDTVIVLFDTGNAPYIIDYVSKKYKENRLILWYWGPVDICVNPKLIDRRKCEIWSFDENDCNKYSFKHNTQFYFRQNINRKCSYNVNNRGVLFVGTEKNRLSIIEEIRELLNNKNIENYFHVVKSLSRYKSIDDYDYKEEITYLQLLSLIDKSTAVLDLVSPEQYGMTLRPLEALFWKKKLITNDKNIRYRDIYNPNNIFIYGVDKPEQLEAFLTSDFDMSNYEKLVEFYSAEKWIERFEIDS